jgi:DNA-binding NtrC family response regulator
MRSMTQMGRRLATYDLPILLEREIGRGKKYIRRALHQMSSRHARALPMLHCAAVPLEMLALAICGHEGRRASALIERRPGAIERAAGSTRLLDGLECIPVRLLAVNLVAARNQSAAGLEPTQTITQS